MTSYPAEQIEELKTYCQSLKVIYEAGIPYFLLESIHLPDGCSPTTCDVVLRPVDNGDGYNSRLFFPAQVESPYPRNWHQPAYLFERNWIAYSWKTNRTDMTLAELLREQLSALVKPQ